MALKCFLVVVSWLSVIPYLMTLDSFYCLHWPIIISTSSIGLFMYGQWPLEFLKKYSILLKWPIYVLKGAPTLWFSLSFSWWKSPFNLWLDISPWILNSLILINIIRYNMWCICGRRLRNKRSRNMMVFIIHDQSLIHQRNLWRN